MPKRKVTKFEFSKSTITNRFVNHWELADDFIEGFLSDKKHTRPGTKIIVNKRRLYLAIESTYQDIARYKNYHQDDPWNDPLDCVKRCAYIVKWIIKFKPLAAEAEDRENPDIANIHLDELEIINELFAIYLFEFHLSNEVDIDVVLSEDKQFELAYDLIYRQISVDGWIAIFQLFKDCCFPKWIRGVPFISKL